MKARLVGVLLPICLMLAGCASNMKVEVRLFDVEGEYCLPSETELRARLEPVAAAAIGQEAEVPVVRERIVKMIDGLLTRNASRIVGRKSIQAKIEKKVDNLFLGFIVANREGVNAFYEAEKIRTGLEARRLLWLAREKFLSSNRAASDFALLLELDLGAFLGEPKTGSEMAEDIRRFGRLAQAEMQANLVVAGQLLQDPLASLITSKEKESCWNSILNIAEAETGVGNSDIAIVMSGLGDFSIKGVRLDAAAVTAAAFDGIKSAISIIASASGLPAAAPGTSATQTPGQLSFDRADKLKVRKDLVNSAVHDFLRGLLSHRNELDDTATRKAAITEAKATYQALRVVLNPLAPPASATPPVAPPAPTPTPAPAPAPSPAPAPAPSPAPASTPATSPPPTPSPAPPATPTGTSPVSGGGTTPPSGGTIMGDLNMIHQGNEMTTLLEKSNQNRPAAAGKEP